mgnify:CR=1 FL=1
MNIDARTARGIWTGGQFVKTNNPKPGDIIIQRNGGHIAIYLGGDKYIGAQNPSAGTAFRSLSQVRDTFNGYYTWVGQDHQLSRDEGPVPSGGGSFLVVR